MNREITSKLKRIESVVSVCVDSQYYSLYIHECGLVIFYTELYRHTKDQKYINKIEAIIFLIIDNINSRSL